MKLLKTFSIILLMQILSVHSFKSEAQVYYPLVDTNNFWSLQTEITGVMHPYSYSYYIKFTNDTTIKGIIYRKVMESDDSIHTNWYNDGYIRETLDKKVYYLPINVNGTIIGTFYLYNFNVKKGDTVYHGGNIVVHSIDSILIGKQFRKRFYLSSGEIWIEGIGSLCGILTVGGCDVYGSENSLLCYTENDTLKYENPAYNYCYYGEVNVNELRNENGELRVYPNPANSLFVVSYSLLEKNNVNLQVYDLLGNEVATLVNQEENKGDYKAEFDAKRLNNGLYFCKLQAGNISETRKIVVVH